VIGVPQQGRDLAHHQGAGIDAVDHQAQPRRQASACDSISSASRAHGDGNRDQQGLTNDGPERQLAFSRS
jgi:hypothetical protein